MKVLVTGANGFVGSEATKALMISGHDVIQSVRQSFSANQVEIGCFDGNTDWKAALRGCDVVLHLAARAHVMRDEVIDQMTAYRTVNTDATLTLARQAAEARVKRFIFVSSVKVNGEQTLSGVPFKAQDVPKPEDPYGVSKYEAEVGLRQLSADTGIEVVIIRPPLVYGPGVKGNFAAMIRLLQRGIPLPFGRVARNRRSFVALGNLVDLLMNCIEHPAAANQTFLVSDDEDLSTADLLRRLCEAMGTTARLLPVPVSLLEAGAKWLGKGNLAQRLLGNLQVDISHTCETLDWKPPISVDEGLRRTVKGLGR